MKKALFVLLAAFALTVQAQVEDPKEYQHQMELFLENSGVEHTFSGTMISTLRMQGGIPESQVQKIAAAVTKSFREDFIPSVMPVYKKYFTVEDLKAINRFYETPVGKKMKKFSMVSTQELQPYVVQWQPKLQQVIMNAMQ